MILPCEGNGGCGQIGPASAKTDTSDSHTAIPAFAERMIDFDAVPDSTNQTGYTQIANIPYENMTTYVPPVPGTTNVPMGSGIAAMSGTAGTDNSSNMTSGNSGGIGMSSASQQQAAFQNAPSFSVPNNPLLPPGYQEILDYGNLQYLNGFLRTQIGKYVRIQQLVGSSVIEERYGYLVGVGINYILLQEISTGNILALDFYNIKYVYFYYTKPDLPQNEIR